MKFETVQTSKEIEFDKIKISDVSTIAALEFLV